MMDITMTIIKRTDWNGNRYDWNRITPGLDLLEDPVVQAAELTDVPDTDIVAVWMDAGLDPIYLIDRNRVLYYHFGLDGCLEHYFPVEEFLRWQNSWEYPEMPFAAREPFPQGWHYMRCYPHVSKTFILIKEELWEAFRSVVAGYVPKHSYHVSCDFPILVNEAVTIATRTALP